MDQHPEEHGGLAAYESSFEHITSHRQMVGILQRLILEHAHVSVVPHNSTERYSSTLLGVEPDSGAFLLDELNPHEGRLEVLQRRTLRVVAQIDGAAIHFAAVVQEIAEHRGIAYYRLARPEQISYRQRRNSYRIQVESLFEVPVVLGDGDRKLVCNLHDISSNGVSLSLSAAEGECPELKRLDHFPFCTIRLPNGLTVECSFEIRNLRHDGVERRCIVGGRLVVPDSRERQQLSRTVTAFERYAIRNRRQER